MRTMAKIMKTNKQINQTKKLFSLHGFFLAIWRYCFFVNDYLHGSNFPSQNNITMLKTKDCELK